MNFHVQNPYTRSPQVFMHLTVEEVQQLASALRVLRELAQDAEPIGSVERMLTANEFTAFNDLTKRLDEALLQPRPWGIKGATP